MSAEVREPSPKYLVQTDYRTSDIGPIPRDWTLSTVGVEFNVQLGKMLDADRNVGIEKPYLGNRAVQWGRIDVSDVQNIRMTKADLEKFRLQRGDLLVCEGGEVGRAAIWNAEIAECYYQKALHRLRPLRGYEPSLMLALLQLYASRGVLSNYVTQTSIAHLPKEKFVAIPIPRPEPEEQRAIATALADVDALIAGLEKLIAKKRDLKQAAMQQLLTGQTRLPGFSGEWVSRSLGSLGVIYGGLIGKSKADFGHGSASYVPFVNVMANIRIDCGALELVNVASTENQNRVLCGDLLFNGSSETPEEVALCAFMTQTVEDLYLNSFCFGFRFKQGVESSGLFLTYFMRSQMGRELMKSLAQGSTRYNLSKSALLQATLLLPNLEEQTAIATVLSDMDADLSALEARLAKTRDLKQGMMQELLTGRTRLV